MDKTFEIPLCEQYSFTIKEAAVYFRIGEKKIRQLVKENPDAEFYFMNGNRIQIKRRLFEEYIDAATVV